MKKISALLLGLFILTSFSLYAQPQMGKSAMGKGGKKLLKLTTEQEKQFEDITYKHQQSVIDIHSKIQKNRLELKKMITDGKVDEKAILQLVDENTKLQNEIKTSSVKRWFEINKILNDDQKATWQKMLVRIVDNGPMKAGMQNMMNKRGMKNMQKHGMGNMQGRASQEQKNK